MDDPVDPRFWRGTVCEPSVGLPVMPVVLAMPASGRLLTGSIPAPWPSSSGKEQLQLVPDYYVVRTTARSTNRLHPAEPVSSRGWMARPTDHGFHHQTDRLSWS